ncbi:sigma-70 family RNA polymerase sigma factor [Psychroserpens sp.]|uniref:sigma-70 family RNA polymerase sigma factor n=1 Tax=Psychroserpens sp. TaxID=2020870 RepID=UPI001AFF3F06|nr:sigma-70 family RNA polymerase sigma factor [Psychroserpens sp.]MBO6606179.1 sigma-70 family RNA polymerase sigma factor [Psychroserpens sp.]MBO6631949.1 sigma-70 family RNA polymerase sigma factor [Psychroserpens sp.]MBO6652449.1 sigma-70 family RNA polymerase sigma factor [Psychroserpens sp.]MBO6681779.1 sigma-70 family RNA polymerase sigma factor [Psychroserpens sp.]MBO6749554.1 sigma-70 family RNA polymerase sigma factor [Psychroserpens sp.]
MPKHVIDPNQWINLYSDYLFNYTISRVNDREIAKDLVQDTFMAGLKSMKNFKGDASERTWLISILKRKIIDYYRKINSNKGKAEVRINYSDSESEGDWLEERVADPFDKTAEDNLENSELGDAIYNCLGKLPEKQAQVFKMKTILNYETEAICNELGITASNLWVIIHRARTAMASCLEDNWF